MALGSSNGIFISFVDYYQSMPKVRIKKSLDFYEFRVVILIKIEFLLKEIDLINKKNILGFHFVTVSLLR